MKYKYGIPIIILLVLNSVIQNKKREKEKKIYDLISNDVKFSGVVTDLKVSGNHDFGVISIYSRMLLKILWQKFTLLHQVIQKR